MSAASTSGSLNLDRVDEDDDEHNIDTRINYSSKSAVASSSSSRTKRSSLKSRWLVLGLACVVMTGSYYAYDIPSALHQQLQDYMPPSTHFETQFNLLYTVYSIPNVILPLFGGNIVDRYGAPTCLTLFASLTLLGASILSMGVANKAWHLMYFGRFIFGLGGESLCVAQSTILSEWFEGREVAFAMGVGLAVSRLGSILNNVWSPQVANHASSSSHGNGGGIVNAFWLGAFLTGCSLAFSGVIVVIDKRAIRSINKRSNGGNNGGSALESLTEALLEGSSVDFDLTAGGGNKSSTARRNIAGENASMVENPCVVPESGVHITDVRKFGPLFWLLTISCFVIYGCVLPFNNVASGLLLERNFFASSPESCHLQYSNECTSGYLQEGSNPSLDSNGNVCSVDSSQAPLLPSSVNFSRSDSNRSSTWEESSYVYSDLTDKNVDCGDPFWLEGCTLDFCTKQNSATEHAGKVMSIPYFISACSSPLLGHLVDRIGRRAQLASLASAVLLVVHLALALADSSPVGPLIGQGIAYSLYAAVLWPSVPLVVSKQFTGTAFGVITSIQNIGLAIFPLIIAAIYNASGGKYIPNVEFFFVSCAVAGVMVGVVMMRMDRKMGGKLYKVSAEENDDEEDERRNVSTGESDDEFENAEDEIYFSPLIRSGEASALSFI